MMPREEGLSPGPEQKSHPYTLLRRAEPIWNAWYAEKLEWVRSSPHKLRLQWFQNRLRMEAISYMDKDNDRTANQTAQAWIRMEVFAGMKTMNMLWNPDNSPSVPKRYVTWMPPSLAGRGKGGSACSRNAKKECRGTVGRNAEEK